MFRSRVAEGFGRKSDKDFANFLYMAKGSSMEAISHLYVALDQNYISKDDFDQLRDSFENVARMLINLIKYLESNPKR